MSRRSEQFNRRMLHYDEWENSENQPAFSDRGESEERILRAIDGLSRDERIRLDELMTSYEMATIFTLALDLSVMGKDRCADTLIAIFRNHCSWERSVDELSVCWNLGWEATRRAYFRWRKKLCHFFGS